jgi:hypothetical protein
MERGIIVVCKSFYWFSILFLQLSFKLWTQCISCSIDFQFDSCSFPSNSGPNVSCSVDFQFDSCSFPSNSGPNVSCSIDFQFGSCTFPSNCGPRCLWHSGLGGCLAAWLGWKNPFLFWTHLVFNNLFPQTNIIVEYNIHDQATLLQQKSFLTSI